MKRNEGFTLVELLVSFTVGAIVALAATSVLLLGLRFNAISGGTAQRQNTTRILLTVFENLATEQQIHSVDYTYDSWKINGGKTEAGNQTNQVLLHYDSATQTIYARDNSVLVEGVVASHLIWDEKTNLLSFYVETEDGSYSSSVYWRTAPKTDNTPDPETTVNEIIQKLQANDPKPYGSEMNENLRRFLCFLAGELGSTGKIIGDAEGRYYSEWYIGGYNDNSWNKDTPWCACYVSWALSQSGLAVPDEYPKWFANVDLFMGYFDELERTMNDGKDYWIRDDGTQPDPEPGDIVFFDWDNGEDPEHIGVVLYVDSQHYIYTIEGNSAGIVAVRKYAPKSVAGSSSPTYDYIIGYGKLPWT